MHLVVERGRAAEEEEDGGDEDGAVARCGGLGVELGEVEEGEHVREEAEDARREWRAREQQAGGEGAARSLELRRRQRRRREETCSSSRSGFRLGLRRGSGFEPEQLCHGSGRVRVRLRVRVRAGAAAP